ncbi:MAG: energy transducer TonB [Steroidobacteraceae bacterium]
MVVLGVIIGMHILMFIALKTGLAAHGVALIQDIVAVDLPPPPKEDEKKEPPPPPPVDRLPPTVPPPMIDLGPDTGPSEAISNVVITDKPQAAPPPKPAAPAGPTQQASLDVRKMGERIKPPYPSASRRLGEEGKVILLVRVGVDGRVVDASVDQSSGFPRLDEAAQQHVIKYYRFKPAMSAGTPVETQVRVPISFKLEE